MQKNIKKYIYRADASADASLPRFLENDASAASLPKNASASLPLRATLGETCATLPTGHVGILHEKRIPCMTEAVF